jgi:hypothetical protein
MFGGEAEATQIPAATVAVAAMAWLGGPLQTLATTRGETSIAGRYTAWTSY